MISDIAALTVICVETISSIISNSMTTILINIFLFIFLLFFYNLFTVICKRIRNTRRLLAYSFSTFFCIRFTVIRNFSQYRSLQFSVILGCKLSWTNNFLQVFFSLLSGNYFVSNVSSIFSQSFFRIFFLQNVFSPRVYCFFFL